MAKWEYRFAILLIQRFEQLKNTRNNPIRISVVLNTFEVENSLIE